MDREQLNWTDLPRIADLHRELIALDLMYHDISPNGLYHRLQSKNVVDAPLVSDDLIRLAMWRPWNRRLKWRPVSD